MGSPPPEGSKKEVLKWRSVSNIVMAAASTGRARRSKNTVTKILQTKSGNEAIKSPGVRMLRIVTIILIAPNSEERPAKCKLKIAKSTAPPEWTSIPERGGYTVQPVPAPDSKKAERSKREKEGGSNQKLKLFKRGKAISGAPIIKGTSQLPKPPTIAGITMKKIIIKAWAVTQTL